jgi:para-nitrobenzyl esterase
MSGESSLSLYNGRRLAMTGEVVVVSLNYRLGALGFLHFAELAKAAGIADEFCDNPGLRDQVAALKWINENISAFGGDPGNVTIFGESAGGSSVISLICAPDAKGLFHRVIAQSPAPSCIYGTKTGTFYAKKYLELLGLKPKEVGKLMDLPADTLARATQQLLDWNAAQLPGSVPFGPTTGTPSMPLDPLAAAANGATANVPLIIGTNHDEATLFENGDPPIVPATPALINKMLDITNPDKKSLILSAYPGYPSRKTALEAATDIIFQQPSIQFAEVYLKHAPVWMYRYDYVPPLPCMLRMGSTHGSEIVHVFHTYDTMPGFLLTLFSAPGTKKRLGGQIQQAWINFAIYGNPNGKPANDISWPAYETTHRSTHIFGSKKITLDDPDKIRREAWEGVTTYR